MTQEDCCGLKGRLPKIDTVNIKETKGKMILKQILGKYKYMVRQLI
jgi:hypothetical protein